MERVSKCKTCSNEFTNLGRAIYCPECAKERSKQKQKEYFARVRKKRNVGIREDGVIEIEDGKCLSDTASVETLLKIQSDLKIYKKGYMKMEEILAKYRKFEINLLKKYIKRCLED
jgi:uncharacterized Zn ribbon protein